MKSNTAKRPAAQAPPAKKLPWTFQRFVDKWLLPVLFVAIGSLIVWCSGGADRILVRTREPIPDLRPFNALPAGTSFQVPIARGDCASRHRANPLESENAPKFHLGIPAHELRCVTTRWHDPCPGETLRHGLRAKAFRFLAIGR